MKQIFCLLAGILLLFLTVLPVFAEESSAINVTIMHKAVEDNPSQTEKPTQAGPAFEKNSNVSLTASQLSGGNSGSGSMGGKAEKPPQTGGVFPVIVLVFFAAAIFCLFLSYKPVAKQK